MSDTEDVVGEDFDWTDEPGPGMDIASRESKPRVPPRSLTGDAVRFRRRAAASPRWLLFLTLAVAVLVAIVVAVVVLSGGSDQATSPATTSPATTPPPTQSQPGAAPTARPAIVVSAAVTLRAGDRGSAVRTLQRALRRLGFTVGSLDGVFGAKTEAAVIAFQRANALKADGLVGAQTAQALNRALARAG